MNRKIALTFVILVTIFIAIMTIGIFVSMTVYAVGLLGTLVCSLISIVFSIRSKLKD